MLTLSILFIGCHSLILILDKNNDHRFWLINQTLIHTLAYWRPGRLQAPRGP